MKKDTDILEEREHTHGDFKTGAKISDTIISALQQGEKWETLVPYQKMALVMIAVKLSRITNGNPAYKDSWDDVAGYAQLGGGDLNHKADNDAKDSVDDMVNQSKGRMFRQGAPSPEMYDW